MNRLRTQASQTKTVLFRNVGSLYLRLNLNIDDVRSDYNTQKADADIVIFVESKLCLSDRDDVHQLHELMSYRNDFRLAMELLCTF